MIDLSQPTEFSSWSIEYRASAVGAKRNGNTCPRHDIARGRTRPRGVCTLQQRCTAFIFFTAYRWLLYCCCVTICCRPGTGFAEITECKWLPAAHRLYLGARLVVVVRSGGDVKQEWNGLAPRAVGAVMQGVLVVVQKKGVRLED